MNTKKIGVWGLGVVGKSVITFLQSRALQPTVLAQNYSPEDIQFLEKNNIAYYKQDIALQQFLETHNTIIASPGIDLRPYAYSGSWLTEADLLQKYLYSSCIAITGTLGKTSLTHLLGQLLHASHKKVLLGGNIGTGMLDLLAHQEINDYLVLELSSFQLEHCKTFAPDLAIITNIYPNHLDRHGTLEEYTQAKYKILEYQKKNQRALLPLELYDSVTTRFPERTFSFFSTAYHPKLISGSRFLSHHNYYYIDNNAIIKHTSTELKTLIDLGQLPTISFALNWVILTAILDMLTIDPAASISTQTSYDLPQHRIDTPLVINDISFYNDSKSTLMQATLAAVEKMHTKPLLLFGGLSKGVDRIPQLPLLKNNIKALICFGKEAQQLAAAAKIIDIPACAHATLDEAFNAALTYAQKNDCILLSPGGSSYDLFNDYKERGAHFEELVKKYGAEKC